MNILDQATEMTQGEVWPNLPSLYPDGDSVDDSPIIEVVIDDESAPDSMGDLYEPMDYETFEAMLESDMAWVADAIGKMAEVRL